jgi:hypothetical protein
VNDKGEYWEGHMPLFFRRRVNSCRSAEFESKTTRPQIELKMFVQNDENFFPKTPWQVHPYML